MAYVETLKTAHITLQVGADYGLIAGNIERVYAVESDGVARPDVLQRDVVTADMLRLILPAQGGLMLQVQDLTASLSGMAAERAAAQSELATVTAERAAAQSALATVTAERDALIAARDALAAIPTCSAAQARFALLQAGKLAAIEGYMSALPPIDPAYIYWYFETVWKRDAAILDQLGPAFGLDATAIDDLFALARTL